MDSEPGRNSDVDERVRVQLLESSRKKQQAESGWWEAKRLRFRGGWGGQFLGEPSYVTSVSVTITQIEKAGYQGTCESVEGALFSVASGYAVLTRDCGLPLLENITV